MEEQKMRNVANNSCDEQGIVWDIKYAMQDLYFARFVENGSELKVLFDNGQIFKIAVKECR
ncbi:MAG: hypothetical protein K2G31_02150 [Clostridia bacterium]|nr:hypothetical protein [Clostridia bacterium]